ncbi:MAG: hypothetical protein P8Y02_06455 [Deinococcales bacterium]
MRIAAPNRVTRSYTQRLVAEPGRVFPLLCPVREAEWLERWDPTLVLSRSGVAEPDAVFTTSAGDDESVWYITRHEPEANFVEMIRITPRVTATRLTIQVVAADGGSEATVRYAHTSLGPEGDAVVAAFTEEHYARFMRDWEARLNHFLSTGELLHGELP